ncbi:glycoside hydrolase family 16 protein [Xylariaceae sp. FL0804]|nr:glycoside hydrolase family 16 protein [Xylariaceae sp. FL0804]
MRYQTTIFSLLPGLVAGISPPGVPGFNLAWSADFEGAAGSSPSTDLWNIMDAIDTNNEVETYTSSNSNLQRSGGGTVQFVPRKSSTGHWTSGRIESKGSWTPQAGKVMMASASILIGDNAASTKQGLWPAFWMLGQSIREGTTWPGCGEIDIFEQVDGVLTGHGTVHCGTSSGGPCNEPEGQSGTVAMPAGGFHTWSVKIDLTSSNWLAQTISWQLDGNTYYTVSGATLNDQATWATLAHSPMYMILNVAVGGDWPGPPNDATLDGYGAMMEVAYAAIYYST